MERPLYQTFWEELARRKAMVFMAGPRQSGKTTLARMIAERFVNHTYFNWDLETNKSLLIQHPLFFESLERKDQSTPLVVFDEIHKYHRWKNYLKGIYDQFVGEFRFLVLGSGRLNVYQRGGDSLAGRYFLLTLWPFTLAELAGRQRSFEEFWKDPLDPGEDDPTLYQTWEHLARLSGFPEPFLSGQETTYRLWSGAYHQQVVREDIRDATNIRNIESVATLFALLPSKVGSLLSLESLARDLKVSYNTVQSWLSLFESLFLAFRIPPWSRKISRGLTKSRKIYLYDYAGIPSGASRMENMVAVELLRAVTNWNERGLGNFSLHFLRNKEKEEVDFLIAESNNPRLLVETKEGDDQLTTGIPRFQRSLAVPAIQLVNRLGVYKRLTSTPKSVAIMTAWRWLAGLP